MISFAYGCRFNVLLYRLDESSTKIFLLFYLSFSTIATIVLKSYGFGISRLSCPDLNFLFYLDSGGFSPDYVSQPWFWWPELYWESSQENFGFEKNVCWKGNINNKEKNSCTTFKSRNLSYLCPKLQGVNPWIEVDGGVGPSNAYMVTFL